MGRDRGLASVDDTGGGRTGGVGRACEGSYRAESVLMMPAGGERVKYGGNGFTALQRVDA